MSTTTLPAGMNLAGYLGQDEYWIDGRSRSVHRIADLDERRRGYAARELARAATAYISAMEILAMADGDLVLTVGLICENPRTWIVSTPLYRALSVAGQGVITDVSPVVDPPPGVVTGPWPSARPVPPMRRAS